MGDVATAAPSSRVRLLERRLQRRDEALEEQDVALADAHRAILSHVLSRQPQHVLSQHSAGVSVQLCEQ